MGDGNETVCISGPGPDILRDVIGNSMRSYLSQLCRSKKRREMTVREVKVCLLGVSLSESLKKADSFAFMLWLGVAHNIRYS